jgi:hypothetical protein
VNESQAVLDEVQSLAVDRGWSRVTDFIGSMNQAGPSSLLVAAAPGVDADRLALWLRGQSHGGPVIVIDLDSMADDPGRALAAGRVVMALKAGELLTPADIAAARAILGRPDGSYAIVVTEAERITSEDDLAAVRRMVAGGVLNQSGTGGSRGWMLWTEQTVPEFLAGPVQEDRAWLRRWLTASLEGQPELAFQRASHALSLADDADQMDAPSSGQARSAAPPSHAHLNDRRIPALGEAVAKLHGRVLDYLDAQAAGLKREVTASLGTMRQDLLHDIGNQAPSRDVEARTNLVREHISRWTEDASKLLMVRQDQTARGVQEMVDVIDWSLANEVTRAFIREPYPQPIFAALRTPPVLLTGAAGFAPPAEPASSRGRGPWTPALRTAAVGGVVTAAAAAALYGVALVPVVGGAAIGAAAGTLVRAPVSPLTRRRYHTDDGLVEAATVKLSSLHALLDRELDRHAATIRNATDVQFEGLERDLVRAGTTATARDAAVEELPPQPAAGAHDQLAHLRTRLGVANAQPTTAGRTPMSAVLPPGVVDAPHAGPENTEGEADLPWAATASPQASTIDNRPPWE